MSNMSNYEEDVLFERVQELVTENKALLKEIMLLEAERDMFMMERDEALQNYSDLYYAGNN
jgi:hypothetical protein